jgi:carbamoyl-phosphate synthase small subunit
MAGLDLAKVVSRRDEMQWNEGEWSLGQGFAQPDERQLHVVAYDFGVKRNILRMLASRGCRVTVVPAQTPAASRARVAARRRLPLERPRRSGALRLRHCGNPGTSDVAIPTFGICLGHQILALASGARTYKMKFGHHGGNHPVKDLDTGRVASPARTTALPSTTTLPANVRATHVSLFDGSLQGIEHTDRPAFSFQGHPEASPGPHDIGYAVRPLRGDDGGRRRVPKRKT